MSTPQYPYQSPVAPTNDKADQLPRWEHALFATIVLAAAIYSISCAVRLYALNTLLNLTNQELAGTAADPGRVSSAAHLESQTNIAVQVTFWVMYLLFFGWMIALNRRFAAAGQAGRLRRLPAMITWRIGVLVSLVIVLVLGRTSGPTSLSDLPSAFHMDMFYLAIRLVIGCVYIWCAFAMRGAAMGLRMPVAFEPSATSYGTPPATSYGTPPATSYGAPPALESATTEQATITET